MIKYLIIILLFLTQITFAQTQPSGFPTQFNTGWQQWGYQQSTLGTIIAKRDTTFLPRFNGTIVFRPQNIRPYYYDSTALRWYKLFSEPDTLTTLATRYDLTQLSFTNSNIGTGYRWAVPNTNNIKTVFVSNTILWDSTSNLNGLTAKADTSVLATQYDISGFASGSASANQITYWTGPSTIGGDAGMTVNSTTNSITADTIRSKAYRVLPDTTFGAKILFTQGDTSVPDFTHTLLHYRVNPDYPTRPNVVYSWGFNLLNEKPWEGHLRNAMEFRYQPFPGSGYVQREMHLFENKLESGTTTRHITMLGRSNARNSSIATTFGTHSYFDDRDSLILSFGTGDVTALKQSNFRLTPWTNSGNSGQLWVQSNLTDILISNPVTSANTAITFNSNVNFGARFFTSNTIGVQADVRTFAINQSASTQGALRFTQAGLTTNNAGISMNGGGVVQYFSVGINENNNLGVTSANNGASILFDSRGSIAPIRFMAKPNGSTTSVESGGLGINGKWYLGGSAESPAVGLYLNYTDAIRIPIGTTLQRPSGAVGYFRANSDSTNLPEFYDGTNWQALASRNWVRSNFATGNTLYTGDGTLPTDRVVTANTNTLTITGSAAFADGAQFDAITSGSVGIAIRGQSTDGRGVMGLATTGVGVYGSATGAAGYGLFGISSGSGGNAIYGSTTSGLILQGAMNPTSTNTVIPAISLTRSSQSAGANGIGQSIDLYNHTSTTDELSNQLISKWTDATNATRTSQFEIHGVNSAVSARKLAVAGSGQLTLDAYGSETFTGAPIKLLAETSTGAIIEVGGRNVQSGTTYTVLSTDVYKIIGLSNTAARTITLPAANAFPSGVTVWFKDEAGTAGTGNITINRAGSDTIDGATSYTISSNYGFIGLYSNGSNAWFVR